MALEMNKPHKRELLFFLVAILVLGISLYFLGPSIIGFVVREFSYTDSLNLVITSNGNYTWQLSDAGDLKYVKIDGTVTRYGRAKAYIESNGIKYLIFDSAMLNLPEANESNLITGFAANDENKKEKNKKPQWAGPNEFIVNGTALINLSQQFSDEDNDALVYSASNVEGLLISISSEIASITGNGNFTAIVSFTASDGIDSKSHTVRLIVTYVGLNEIVLSEPSQNETLNGNETLNATGQINQTINEAAEPEANITFNQTKEITASLSYNPGTIYDTNDNGEETINGVVDLAVEAELNWDFDESKLCARWEIYNAEDSKSTTLCNGNNDCCAFIGLLPTKSNWNETYYSTFGKDGSGYENIVSAQVIYYDVNLTQGTSEVYYSGWGNKSVKFFDDQIEFFNECIDSCALSGLNKSSYTLLFEIEDDAVLRIDAIKYSVAKDIVNSMPLLLQNFSAIDISRNKNVKINLSQYFADPDGDALSYGYYKADGITILFDGDIATISAEKNAEGILFTYITANDSENLVASNVFMVNIQEEEAEAKYFEIRDKEDNKLAVFDSLGNLEIKGILAENIEPFADENDFAVYNSTNGPNLVVMNPEGNVLVKGALVENQQILIPTPGSFIIQNENNETIAYVDSTGSLFLKGVLRENVLFG